MAAALQNLRASLPALDQCRLVTAAMGTTARRACARRAVPQHHGTPKRAPVTVPLTLKGGDILMAEGKLDKGLACYRRVLDNAATICKQGNGNDATKQELVDAIMKIGTSAIWFILDRRFDGRARMCRRSVILFR